MNELLIHPRRLSFQLPDVLGGLLFPGTKGEEGSPCGNGDCVLLDGGSGLVGVADGSERSPEASRAFLRALARRLETCPPPAGGERFEAFQDAARCVLEGFSYEERTTFVCVLPDDEGGLHYLAGGDSVLLRLDPRGARVRFRNRANMGFAGRSRTLLDCGRVPVEPGDLVVLGTDGLWDLAGRNVEALFEELFRKLRTDPLHLVPERLVRAFHPAHGVEPERPYDDFCMILLDPLRLSDLRSRVLLGGTTDRAERAFRGLLTNGALPDRLLPLGRDPDVLHVLPDDLPIDALPS